MGHEYLASALVELMQIRKPPSGADRVLHHPPEAFDRIEVMATMGRQEMAAKLLLIVVEGRVQLMRPMDATAIDDHDDLLASFAKDFHDLMEIWAQFLGSKMGHALIEDPRRAILDRPDHAEQDTAGDATPGAILGPRLAFERLFPFALCVTPRADRQASALGAAPPAPPGKGKAPQDSFIFVEQNDFTPPRSVFKGGEVDRAIGEIGWRGIEPSSGATVAYRVFFKRQRTLSRPSWTPVSRAKTVASS
jgi:hypothetical protein